MFFFCQTVLNIRCTRVFIIKQKQNVNKYYLTQNLNFLFQLAAEETSKFHFKRDVVK